VRVSGSGGGRRGPRVRVADSELIAEGWEITLEDLAVLSPYLTARIQRFGVYATEEVALVPEPFDTRRGFDLAFAS